MFCFELIKKIIFHLTFLTFYKEVLLDLVRCINHHACGAGPDTQHVRFYYPYHVGTV